MALIFVAKETLMQQNHQSFLYFGWKSQTKIKAIYSI